MSCCAAVILPKYPSVDFNQFLSKSHCQPLSSSYLNDMWRTFLRRAPRSYPSSSSPPLCTPISNFLEGDFYSRKGCILELRMSREEYGRLLSRSSVSFLQRERSRILPGKSPCSGILSVTSVKGLASVAEAVEVLSSTDVDDDIASIEGTQVFLEGVNSVEEAIADNSAGRFREMAQQPKRQRKRKTKMIAGLGDGKYATLRRRQYKIETGAWAQAAQEYQELLSDMCEKKLAPNLPYMKSLFLGWFEPFRDQISAEQELFKNPKHRSSLAPYFNELPPDMMAVITMHKLMSLLMIGTGDACCRVVKASCQIGEAIEHEAKLYRFLQKSKQTDSNKKNQNDNDDPIAKENGRLRKKVEDLMKKQKLPQLRRVIEGQEKTKPWGQDAQAKVGSRLIELLIDTAYIQPSVDQQIDGSFDIRPAFRHTLKTFTLEGNNSGRNSSKRYGVIECDALVRQGLERTAKHMVIPYMPMLIPPVNWTGYEKGGHLFLPSYIMRTHGARKQRSALKMTPKKQLQPVFEALNTLGEVRWRINKRVLGIVDRLWSSGGCLADLVDREDIPLPEKPDTEDQDEIKRWKWKLSETKKENSERHSLRCDVELKLAVARKMKDEEGFYYPHNLDFRGRAYPMHPHLNHLGSDLCRGVLEFAEGRPLGKSGLLWLKIHLANLFGNGIDKKSYEGRIAFTENHLSDIFDSADRPFEGERWWLTAEDPFQCLAVCINIAEALRSSSPETTISHLPVHQDGSCNGLQHYAALGRDKLGAAAVNLIAGDKPSDVYSSIAARVLEIMQRDAEKVDAADSNVAYARLLIGHVDRKLVKQTVMTSVYGVTFIGAREQIKKRLKERNVNMDNSELFKASCYAAKITLTALEEMFQAARSIMTWLGDCAKLIALENQPVRWTTPLGLPVVQPYNKLKAHMIRTSLQILTLQRESDLVMVKRQRTAFPPNFIHSLDGSHMMMTAVACRNAGLNFAGVHDSYWTHACDVDVMNKILREKFVELYEQPILETLLESFKASFPTLTFPSTPVRGDFDVKEVLNSPYFFN